MNQIMVLAGEPSGDELAAQLVSAMSPLLSGRIRPSFFGLGGPKLEGVGVELLEDMTQHTVFGLSEVLKQYRHYKRIFDNALQEAFRRQPDLIVLVDFGGFNLRFAKAIRKGLQSSTGVFRNWRPRIVYFVPPQVWASRSYRAATIAQTIDLVVSILPFEKEWYQARFPALPIQYVGDPMAGRFHKDQTTDRSAETAAHAPLRIAILPGSRKQEIERHLPLMLEAVQLIARHRTCQATVVTPRSDDTRAYREQAIEAVSWSTGSVETVLRQSDLAIACSGTVTRECAYLRIPTVVIYKLSWLTYQIAKRIVQVRFIAMPNILADKMIFPELIQDAATATAIAQEAIQLSLGDDREQLMLDMERVVLSLGPPGATTRAAEAILKLR